MRPFISVISLVVLTYILPTHSLAKPWRICKKKSACCCRQLCASDGRKCAPPPNTCAIARAANLGGGVWLYYAEYNELDCSNPQPVYMIGNYGIHPNNHICENDPNACEMTLPFVTREVGRIPHFVNRDPHVLFTGFPTPLPHTHDIDAQLNIVEKSVSWAKFNIEGIVYKAKVFHLGIDLTDNGTNEVHKVANLAVEVTSFPNGVDPVETKLSDRTVKRCQGQHAFSISTGGQRVLFLLDRAG